MKCDIYDIETCDKTVMAKAHSLLNQKIIEKIIDEDNQSNL